PPPPPPPPHPHPHIFLKQYSGIRYAQESSWLGDFFKRQIHDPASVAKATTSISLNILMIYLFFDSI
ncbi:MAG: hypothetical protein K2I35_06685, partial [Duncaniella sp.]|nr:hypothetical protein [Duncaniella sp.]